MRVCYVTIYLQLYLNQSHRHCINCLIELNYKYNTTRWYCLR